jgi:hypothetical protein
MTIMLSHAPFPPPLTQTLVRFTLVRRASPPARVALARFRLVVKRPTLAASVDSADLFLAHAEKAAERAHLVFRMRGETTFHGELYAPIGKPPRVLDYVTQARFDLRGPSTRALAPLVGRLAHSAYLVSFEKVPVLNPQDRARIERTLETRVLRAVRRTAVRDCRLLGDPRASIDRVFLSRFGRFPFPPHPLAMRGFAVRRMGFPPPTAATKHVRLTVRAAVSVVCTSSP